MTNDKNVTAEKQRIIRVSPETHSALKVLAVQQSMTISEAADTAIRFFVGPAPKRQKVKR